MADNNPLVDRTLLEEAFGKYEPGRNIPEDLPNLPFRPAGGGGGPLSAEPAPSALTALEKAVTQREGDGRMFGGSLPRTVGESVSPRYSYFVPGDYNNEDAYAQGQGWTSKMLNGVGKGLALTGTTFLQSTAGLVNGLARMIYDGRAASFYDNDFNRTLDELNKTLEDKLPNYYTDAEKNAAWYSPTKLFTANFFWDGIIKNLGFAAGAALSGGVYAAGLKALPLTARLFSVGKAAEALAATEEALFAGQKVANTYGKIKSLSDRFVTSYNVLNPAGRAVVAGLATTGEAGFEAYHNMNDFRDQKIREFEQTYGVPPAGADLERINREAESIGNSSFLMNVGLLSATNYIQFPKILGSSYKAEKGIINSLTKEISDVTLDSTGKYIATPSKLGRISGALNTIRPYLFSASEGFEEGAQYAIGIGTKDYYNKKYRGESTSFIDSLSQGITQTLGTDEGMENVLIGGLSGALMQAKGKFTEAREIKANTAAAVEAFNKFKLSDFSKDTIDSVNRGTVIQEEREKFLKSGDILNSKDAEFDYIINYLTPRIKYGRFDLVQADIEDYKRLASTEEGFAQLQSEGKALLSDTRDSYLLRLSGFETTANNVKSLYQSLSLRYSGLRDAEGNALYPPAVMDQMVYAASKIADYDTRLPQVSLSLLQAGVLTTDIVDSIGKENKPNAEALDKAVEQINDLDVNSEIKDELKSDLADLIELSTRRKLFIDEYSEIKKNPKNYIPKTFEEALGEDKKVEVDQVEESTGEVVKKELEVDKEYSLSDVTFRDGNKIIPNPKVKVISKTLGGELEVRLPNGKITFVTPDQLKEYNISDTLRPEDSPEINDLVEKAATRVLDRREIVDEFVVADNKLEYVNSLDNPELTNAVEAEIKKLSEEYLQREQKLAEEAAVVNNTKVANDVIATLDNSQPTLEASSTYEPESKKSDIAIVSSTVAPSGKPHHERANKFGANLESFPNRKNIKGVYVTLKNEAELGLAGLMEFLKGDSDADINTTIALVMVEQDPKTGETKLVGVDGKVLEQPTVENTIYQVFPLEEIDWMFRSSTPEEVRSALKEQYAAWRKEVLDNPTLTPFDVQASLGVPQYVTITDDKGNITRDYSARVPVADSGLIKQSDLKKAPVIFIPTVEESISKGSTKFTAVKGLPFLNTPNGYVKLQNRKLTQNEVSTVYEAILQFAKNVAKDKNAKSADSKRLYNWLKSVVYWGTPSDAKGTRRDVSSNSIWFEKTPQGLTLFISNEGVSMPFTPTSIENNQAKIKEILSDMYHTVNATMVNGGQTVSWNEKYEQITSISKDGKIETKSWSNYQTYLLSKEGRDSNNIPLTTQIRPLNTPQDVNREGIYFTVTKTAEQFVVPEVKQVPKVLIPGGPKAPAQPAGTYNLNGQPETFTSPAGKVINFAATPAEVIQKGLDGIKVLKGGDLNEVFEALKKQGLTPEAAQKNIKSIIYKAIEPQLTTESEMEFTIPEDEDSFSISVDDIGEGLDDSAAKLFKKQAASRPDRSALRVKLLEELERFQGEDWNKIESWLEKNFPNVPVYRVKNVINATNGLQAWGMFKDGAIYVYENAEVGTIYHEVFEAVWKSFTDSTERSNILKEFKARKGSFVDRPTGQTINYADATDDQIKEQLAEEFRDYVLTKEAKEPKSLIAKMFSDLVKFIKEFFIGNNAKSNTDKLFEKIGTGYYKNYGPHHASLAFAKKGLIDIEDAFASSDSEFRLKDLRSDHVADVMQHMTYLTLTDLIRNNESLFSVPQLDKTELYNRLKEQVLTSIAQTAGTTQLLVDQGLVTQAQAKQKIADTISLWKSVNDQWDEIVKKHEEKLRTYNIEFDESDELILNDENASKKADYQDANKIDSFKKANAAVKLLLSTIPVSQVTESGNIETVPSSVNGVKLLPTSEVYMAIMNNVHSARSIDEMLENIRQMALNDVNYQALYKRLSKNLDIESPANLTTSLTDMHDVQLLSAFWKTFKKQNPDVRTVFVLDNGDVIVGESNFTTAANQIREEFKNNIVNAVKTSDKYFTYSNKEKAYIGKANSVAVEPKTDNIIDSNVAFLKTLGIEFDKSEVKLNLNTEDQSKFNTAVAGIKKSISEAKKIATISGNILDIDGRLRELAILKAKLDNPEFSSTYFNVNGERTQTFIGTNAASDMFDFLSQLDVFDSSTLAGTQYEYLLTDAFAKNSVMLSKMFVKETGERISKSDNLFKPGYADGLIDSSRGKKKQSAKLTYKERLIQELNLNLKGFYLNLVPGDASMEWMLNMGNAITEKSLLSGFTDVNDIFEGYFIDELNVSREARPIVSGKGRKTTDLRFFKPILGEKLHDKLIAEQGTPEEIYERNQEEINNALQKFITDSTDSFRKNLERYQIVEQVDETYSAPSLALSKRENLSLEELNTQLTMLNVNYMINNIEMHKLLYSDPYQYKDELKRIKSFNSPRQAIISNSPEMNAAMNIVVNRGYEEGDLGYTDMTKDFFRTAAIADVKGVSNIAEYDEWDETDGGGMISFKAYRNFRLRAGDWNDNEERQYRYDIAYEKEVNRIPLTEEERQLITEGNPRVKSAYTPLKPIVSGNKADGNSYNDVVLDKFALYPLSFRVAREINIAGDKGSSNALTLYSKMAVENIDYVVFGTGRKVGATELNEPYNEDGSFNTEPFAGVTNIPFSIMSVQSEVPSKDEAIVTRGSQTTKLITMDFLELGIPADFEEGTDINTRYENWNKLSEDQKKETSELYKEIKNNQEILEEMMDNGFNTLLKRLSIKQVDGGYQITDFSETAMALRNEIFRTEVNDNVSDALQGFLNGDVVLEATPVYKQVRNVLYSIADKQVISPKISGGMKVQIPSTFLEETKTKLTEINGKKGYTSDTLKFYEDKDGKRYAEIMVGRWFSSNMSDKELLDYLNGTEEGQKVLSGLAFRIPTQKQNSIDAFVIKQFLPQEFGDSVVIPSALVKKVGSDFDIDKLNIYFKNVYRDGKGNIKSVPFFGFGKEAISKIKDFLVKQDVEFMLLSDRDIDVTRIEDDYETAAERFYKKSLENAYIESAEKLVTHPKNYERLIKPNSADQLKGLSQKITKKLGLQPLDSSSTESLLNREFMSRLRHAFVTGKYAIGIAAVNQTNHALNQRARIYVDPKRLAYQSEQDREWLGDAEIKFKEFNRIDVDGEMVPTLSMVKNAAGQDISDIIGQFIDGYVDISKGPWIMELGATPNVASTWLFLTKIGVPIDTVAYFMNQPIVRDYLAMVENAGYSWIFIDSFVEDIKKSEKYKAAPAKIKEVKSVPGKTELFNMIGEEVLSVDERAKQQFILDEFLKYSKLASQMFMVTQGSNFDTSTFNDPYLVFKKFEQYKQAQSTMISSVEDILENSFIGKLGQTIADVRDAYAEILISDSPMMRGMMENILRPYINMPDRDFVKLSQKAVADVFDWAVQNNEKYNLLIKELLLDDTKNAAKEVNTFVKEVKKNPRHPLYNNQIIKNYDPKFSANVNGVNNVSIINKDNKVYDQNNIIYAFNELKQYLNSQGNIELYEKLVKAAVIQSGLSNSPISFTSLLPYEDFKNVYNKTLSKLESLDNFALNDYLKLNAFQRNNWSDDDVVPYRRASWSEDWTGMPVYNKNMKFNGKEELMAAMEAGTVPPLLKLSTLAREANADVIVYTWEDMSLSRAEKNEMRKAGDYSFINKALFKKVYAGNEPLKVSFTSKGKLIEQQIYKAINAWGDSFRANEFYSTAKQSVIDNGFIKVNEVVDDAIVPYFRSMPVQTQPTTEEQKTDNWEEEDNSCPAPF
jgi:hypothetical protein